MAGRAGGPVGRRLGESMARSAALGRRAEDAQVRTVFEESLVSERRDLAIRRVPPTAGVAPEAGGEVVGQFPGNPLANRAAITGSSVMRGHQCVHPGLHEAIGMRTDAVTDRDLVRIVIPAGLKVLVS